MVDNNFVIFGSPYYKVPGIEFEEISLSSWPKNVFRETHGTLVPFRGNQDCCYCDA
jgi:hypothetical protein